MSRGPLGSLSYVDAADGPAAGTIVWVLEPLRDRAAIPDLCARLTMLVSGQGSGGQGSAVVVCDVSGIAEPDLVTVEALTRLSLTARRLGCELTVRGAGPWLRTLATFVGLAGAVGLPASGSSERRGEAEEREQPVDVEERVDPADPSA
jgi:hypothetical protein